jgi:hypothetical protein
MTVTFTQLGKMGRLGNQLFQISAAIGLAIKNNDSYLFPQWEYEKDFNLHDCFSANDIKITQTYNEPFFHYKEINNKQTRSQMVDLIGYFQSNLYWSHCKDLIINKLSPIHDFKNEEGLCSIHVRRGDYLNFQDCHPVQTMDYYTSAMELSGCDKFLIFSDDIKWCKDNFKGNMFEFSEGQEPAVDLALMSKKCENNIICNSSFSLWGAYLNKYPGKTIIAPSKWFGPKLNHQTKDLTPSSWIKI